LQHMSSTRPPHLPPLHSFPTRRSSDLYSLVNRPGGLGSKYRASGPQPPSGFRSKGGYPAILPRIGSGLLSSGRKQDAPNPPRRTDRKSTRLNSSHVKISYAVFCLKKKK